VVVPTAAAGALSVGGDVAGGESQPLAAVSGNGSNTAWFPLFNGIVKQLGVHRSTDIRSLSYYSQEEKKKQKKRETQST
jgi:hypothetical protein